MLRYAIILLVCLFIGLATAQTDGRTAADWYIEVNGWVADVTELIAASGDGVDLSRRAQELSDRGTKLLVEGTSLSTKSSEELHARRSQQALSYAQLLNHVTGLILFGTREIVKPLGQGRLERDLGMATDMWFLYGAVTHLLIERDGVITELYAHPAP